MIVSSINTTQEYKHCAGKNCGNKGTNHLEIKLIKKNGFFCETCSTELIQSGIASKITVDKNEKV